MELQLGQIVASRRGRDVTEFYMVVGLAPQRVLLANGGGRTLASPKAKNPRHVNPTNTIVDPGEMDTDLKIKTVLRAYAAKCRPEEQGGQKLGKR